MNHLLTQHLELFFGECTAAVGRIYARLPVQAVAEDAAQPIQKFRLSGTIAGPQSRYAHTLSATIPLNARASNDAWLLEGAVPDPCFWMPDEPYLYQVSCQLSDVSGSGGTIAAQVTIAFGFRPLGARGNSLYLAGKRWVPRGWIGSRAIATGMTEAHDAVVAIGSSTGWNNALLADAAAVGALAVQLVSNETDATLLQTIMLGHQPAVGLVALDASHASPDPHHKYGNAVLAQWLRQPPPWQLAPWAQAVIVETSDIDALTAARQLQLPVIVYRPHTDAQTADQARAACDQLQREAALLGDFAGYFV
jgi:hypothetical protein